MRARFLALAAAALAAAACGGGQVASPPPASTDGGTQPPAETGAATLAVTRDFGSEPLGEAPAEAGETVMDVLERAFEVETDYGGAFVQAIDGIEGSASRMEDWLYLVNGVEADVGAADYRLCEGDVVWWDYRSWEGRLRVGAVVGAWPEPFVHGYGSCEQPEVEADAPLAEALREAGARLVQEGADYRALVGSDEELRAREPVWAEAAADPERAGLTAWIEDGRVLVWDAAENEAVEVPEAEAVVTATPAGLSAGDGVVLVVAGLDGAAAERAARAVVADPSLLEHRYAVCLDGGGRPACAGGLGVLRG